VEIEITSNSSADAVGEGKKKVVSLLIFFYSQGVSFHAGMTAELLEKWHCSGPILCIVGKIREIYSKKKITSKIIFLIEISIAGRKDISGMVKLFCWGKIKRTKGKITCLKHLKNSLCY
jgi:hypothetical protein